MPTRTKSLQPNRPTTGRRRTGPRVSLPRLQVISSSNGRRYRRGIAGVPPRSSAHADPLLPLRLVALEHRNGDVEREGHLLVCLERPRDLHLLVLDLLVVRHVGLVVDGPVVADVTEAVRVLRLRREVPTSAEGKHLREEVHLVEAEDLVRLESVRIRVRKHAELQLLHLAIVRVVLHGIHGLHDSAPARQRLLVVLVEVLLRGRVRIVAVGLVRRQAQLLLILGFLSKHVDVVVSQCQLHRRRRSRFRR
mmetsp:Transcript_588/g.1229  ORF Transcript_588/g.1229 Transcript_588/m.1229 type:complete len:250 (-) Transcript_588:18-767(-)